jgi:hypothetical protein
VSRVRQRRPGEPFVVDLDHNRGKHNIECCSCGLTHNFCFTVDEISGHLVIQAWVDKKKTKKARKERRKK